MTGNEGLIDLTDILRLRVYDSEGRHVGHVQDLAMTRGASRPLVTSVGVHLEWTDRVGGTRLVRPAEDVVILVPWSEVDEFDEERLRLTCRHPELPAVTSEGKLLVRRDILDKQMTDAGGSRLHRVDDILLERDGRSLLLAGLKVSPGMLIASPGLRVYIARLKNRFRSRYETLLVPWEAIEHIGDESIVIKEPGAMDVRRPSR